MLSLILIAADCSYQVRSGVSLPSFLKDFLAPIIRAGQQLQVLIKLFEFCKYIAPGINTYDEFLPCWKGFSDPSYTSPLTFSKGSIEELVLGRNSYYNKMQEKLEEISAKLEFRYHQVMQCDNVVSAVLMLVMEKSFSD